MSNVMVALPNIGGAFCGTPQSLADAHYYRCRAVTLPRRETSWNFAGVPQTGQPISTASRPKFTILCGHVEEIFFPIVDTCLSCEDIPDKVVRWCPDGDFWPLFRVLYFQGAACSRFQTCILNSH